MNIRKSSDEDMQSYIIRLINQADQLKDFDEQCSESENCMCYSMVLMKVTNILKVQSKFRNQFHSMKHVISSFPFDTALCSKQAFADHS